MSRPIFKIREEKEKLGRKEIEKLKTETIAHLSSYLEDYLPKSKSYSKHAIMGPVGKLISKVTSGQIKDKDALMGFVINVHRNTAKFERIGETAVNHLEAGIATMLQLRNALSKRGWVHVAREIDYGVYKKKYEYILKKAKEKKEGEK